MGLGLAIARESIDTGVIRNRNLPGKGCIFTIDLPLIPAEPATATGGAPPPRATPVPSSCFLSRKRRPPGGLPVFTIEQHPALPIA